MAAIGELTPVFSFGLIGDPQYADKPDGAVEGRCQRHREVPPKLQAAVQGFGDLGTGRLGAVLVLGDVIDGAASGKAEDSKQELELVCSILEGASPLKVLHVLGNHDLAAPRDYVLTRMGLKQSYYSLELAPGWRLLVLDTCDMALCPGLDQAQASPSMQEARAYLAAHPLSPQEPQMSDWNGGVGSAQLKWLKEELAAAGHKAERVIVASHHPLGHGSARETHMAWNWKEVQDLLVGSKVVVLALAGHDHVGGSSCVGDTHFVTMQALLEAPTGSNAYAIVDVYHDHIHIKGVGSARSHKLHVPKLLMSLS